MGGVVLIPDLLLTNTDYRPRVWKWNIQILSQAQLESEGVFSVPPFHTRKKDLQSKQNLKLIDLIFFTFWNSFSLYLG